MVDILDRIAAIEEEIKKTPYHKGTEHHLGQLKARLAKLKKRALVSRKKGEGVAFALKKTGDATAVLIGPPSVGKSTLLNKLTRAHSRVENWPFSTVKVVPGMLEYKGAQIQIFDLPGIIGGAAKGLGRGREVLSVAKSADLLLLVVDVKTRSRVGTILKEMAQAGITLDPLVVVNKVDISKKHRRVTSEKASKHLQGGRVERSETSDSSEVEKAEMIFISAEKGIGLKELKERIWQRLELMRVYLRPKDKEVNFERPLILKKGSTVAKVAAKIFPKQPEFKQILLWGKSAHFPGQQVSLDRQLEDEDVLTFA